MGTRGKRPERAMLWLPAGAGEDEMRLLMEWCRRRGYEVIGAVPDDGRPELWPDVREMLIASQADVLVAPRWRDLPADRTPRVEAVDCWEPPPRARPEPEPSGKVTPRRRRPRPLR